MDNDVYTGIWTNWSRGAILGQTLTTTKQYGNLLIAFTALFVTFVASRLWRISCLILHRCYSTSADRRAIHHQRQVILRNSHTAESALYEIVSLIWAWRKSRFQRIAGLIPLLIFGVCYLAAFTVAGGFSSSISSSVGDEVLINSQYCGTIMHNNTVEAQNRWDSEVSNSAANYVQQCYGTNQSNLTTACNKFVLSSLPTHAMNSTAECPFQSLICRNPQSTLRLDSGFIDSNDDLGLNAPKNERFAYRYVLHCAPLETNGYISHVEEGGRGWDRYHYGTRTLGPFDNRTDFKDHIYQIEDLNSQYIFPDGINLSGINLKLGFETIGRSRGKPNSWDLIPELVRLDGDTMFAFLSGAGVQFTESMDDDWYRVTTPSGTIYNPYRTGKRQVWQPNVSASPMGCLEQFQWCNSAYPRDRGCGPLASLQDSLYGAAPLFNLTSEDIDPARPVFSDAARARIVWPWVAMTNYPNTLPAILGSLGTKSLASQSVLYSGVQFALPKGQWQLDVLQWWHIIMAAIQATRCFGLYFTFITGALITVASYILEPLLNRIYKGRQLKSYANFEWISNTSLQLHRMAQEQIMGKDWTNCCNEIPTIDPELSLANLDISDPSHPILHRPESLKGNDEAVKSSTVPADSSPSPVAGSLHSESVVYQSGRTPTSSLATSVSDGSWTLDVQTAIRNVSGEFSVEETQHGDFRVDTMDVGVSGGHMQAEAF